MLDDASDDAGVEAALSWVASRDVTNVTVLRNGVNQGYGGNQKLGFRLALDCSFDFAVCSTATANIRRHFFPP